MHLPAAFLRLPYRFASEIVVGQISALPEQAWQPHPLGWDGHQVVPLVTAGGSDDLDRLEGTMRPTVWMDDLPAVKRLLLALDTVVGRTMLLRAAPGSEGASIVDACHYWHRRVRMFMPLAPAEGARWHCGPESTEIGPGEVWLVDGWRGYHHEVPGADPLLCLMADTVGSASFWSTVELADRPLDRDHESALSPRQIKLSGAPSRPLETETVRTAPVMSPFELEGLITAVMADVRSALPDKAKHLPKLEAAMAGFTRQWHGIYARHGEDRDGFDAYRQALEQATAQAAYVARSWKLPNGMDAAELLDRMVIQHALRDVEDQTSKLTAPDTTAAPPSDPESPERPEGDAPGPTAPPPEPATGPDADADDAEPAPSPLRSLHSKSFPQLLQQTQSSLLVTTYQAGKLVVCREDEGTLNTHFRVYNRPMGLAVDNSGRVAVGTNIMIEFYRNMREVASRLEPKGRHDAAYLPRRGHVTGNIDIHEMDWAGDELWFVNTRFSCLCTLDGESSFVPRWRPPFISGYAPEDRCHLNGLEVVDGRPKYVTALGTSDVAGGWRENKAAGGVLMDIETNEIICRGLSMPHSPRWYQGKLWFLESGNGSLATVDPNTGEVDTVAELPGFTRGLDFLGQYAFVGLSQVRESAVFSGIALTERVGQRNCGVWVVDIRSGEQVGFLKFEDAVQEVFAVSVLPGIRYPDLVASNDPQISEWYALPDEALAEVVGPAAAANAAAGPGGAAPQVKDQKDPASKE